MFGNYYACSFKNRVRDVLYFYYAGKDIYSALYTYAVSSYTLILIYVIDGISNSYKILWLLPDTGFVPGEEKFNTLKKITRTSQSFIQSFTAASNTFLAREIVIPLFIHTLHYCMHEEDRGMQVSEDHHQCGPSCVDFTKARVRTCLIWPHPHSSHVSEYFSRLTSGIAMALENASRSANSVAKTRCCLWKAFCGGEQKRHFRSQCQGHPGGSWLMVQVPFSKTQCRQSARILSVFRWPFWKKENRSKFNFALPAGRYQDESNATTYVRTCITS